MAFVPSANVGSSSLRSSSDLTFLGLGVLLCVLPRPLYGLLLGNVVELDKPIAVPLRELEGVPGELLFASHVVKLRVGRRDWLLCEPTTTGLYISALSVPHLLLSILPLAFLDLVLFLEYFEPLR